ncbi:MAG: RDD family protein [Verrucomicrobiaceae bacterium]|nr:RDD family protein [Verrucomicrobiaceae bacterium]
MSDDFNPYAAPLTEKPSREEPLGELPLATRWRRFCAAMIDTLILMVIMVPTAFLFAIYLVGLAEFLQNPEAYINSNELLWGGAAFLLSLAVNWVFMANGQTIGKYWLRMRIVMREDGRVCSRSHNIFLRMLPMQIVSMIPGIGSFLVLIDCLMIFRKSRLTLHDDLAKTKVVDLRPVIS